MFLKEILPEHTSVSQNISSSSKPRDITIVGDTKQAILGYHHINEHRSDVCFRLNLG